METEGDSSYLKGWEMWWMEECGANELTGLQKGCQIMAQRPNAAQPAVCYWNKAMPITSHSVSLAVFAIWWQGWYLWQRPKTFTSQPFTEKVYWSFLVLRSREMRILAFGYKVNAHFCSCYLPRLLRSIRWFNWYFKQSDKFKFSMLTILSWSELRGGLLGQ